MKRISAILVFVVNIIALGIVFGAALGARSCSTEEDYNEEIQSIEDAEEERKEELRFYRVLAGIESGPETSYYAMVREILAMPSFQKRHKDAKLSTVIGIVDDIQSTSAGVLGLFEGHTTPEIKVFAPLRAHKSHKKIAAYPKDMLNDIFMGKTEVPEKLTVAAVFPPPFVYWKLSHWFFVWFASAFIFWLSLFFLLVFDDLRPPHIINYYPWRTVGGAFALLTSAPMSLIVIIGYMGFLAVIRVAGYRILTKGLRADWALVAGGVWEWTRKTAYRFRLIRKLPPPALDIVHLHDVGELEVLEAESTEIEGREVEPEMVQLAASERRNRPEGSQWFAFRPELIRGHHHELEKAGLKLVKITLNQPYKFEAYGVPLSGIDAFERVVNLADSPVEYEDTDVRSMFLCSYHSEVGNITVSCAELKYVDRVKKMMRQLSRKHGGINIVFDFTQKLVPEPELRTDGVVIYHCTRPCDQMMTYKMQVVFGRKFEAPGLTLIAADASRGEMICDTDGNVVAQIIGRNIFTLVYGLLSNEVEWADEALMQTISRGITSILSQESKEIQEVVKEVEKNAWRANLDTHRKGYIHMAITKFHREEKDIESSISECDFDVDETRKIMATKLRSKKKLQKRLDHLRDGTMLSFQEELVKEFDQLAASDHVAEVRCQDGFIDVYTVPLFIFHGEKQYEIGRFRLRLSDQGHIGIANIENTSTTTDWHHPHIPPDGKPCFGNVNESLAQYLSKRQFAIVVTILYRFLEQYNPHQGVQLIHHWKEVKNVQTA